MCSYLLRFYRVYKISLSVHVYRHRNLQRECRHFTEIRLTFIKSVNSSSFPVAGARYRKVNQQLCLWINAFVLLTLMNGNRVDII